MAIFKPIKCTSSQLNSITKKEGQFIVVTDTKKIYYDNSSSSRIELAENLMKYITELQSDVTKLQLDIKTLEELLYTYEGISYDFVNEYTDKYPCAITTLPNIQSVYSSLRDVGMYTIFFSAQVSVKHKGNDYYENGLIVMYADTDFAVDCHAEYFPNINSVDEIYGFSGAHESVPNVSVSSSSGDIELTFSDQFNIDFFASTMGSDSSANHTIEIRSVEIGYSAMSMNTNLLVKRPKI